MSEGDSRRSKASRAYREAKSELYRWETAKFADSLTHEGFLAIWQMSNL